MAWRGRSYHREGKVGAYRHLTVKRSSPGEGKGALGRGRRALRPYEAMEEKRV